MFNIYNKKYMKTVLSLDGGGIRGIISSYILCHLENQLKYIANNNEIKLADYVDFVAGTSTGSIIGSLMLTPSLDNKKSAQYSMCEIVYLYTKLGPNVFSNSIWNKIRSLWGLIHPKFSKTYIEDSLLDMLGEIEMKDLIKPCLFTGYDIDKRRINIFTNNDMNKKYHYYQVKDIIRGSTSIPAFFPPAYFKINNDYNTLIDGGVFANNPALVAYTEISKTCFDSKKPESFYPSDVLMISIGSGRGGIESYKYSKVKKWGMAKWLIPILDILLSAASDVVDYQIKKLFESYYVPENYYRINPTIKYGSNSAVDTSEKNMQNLITDAKNYIESNRIYLNDLALKIYENKST